MNEQQAWQLAKDYSDGSEEFSDYFWCYFESTAQDEQTDENLVSYLEAYGE